MTKIDRHVLAQARALAALTQAAWTDRFAAQAKACRALLPAGRGAQASLSRALFETAVEFSWAAAESDGVELAAAAQAVRGAAEEFARALEKGREEPLLDCKRHAAEAERLCRAARASAHCRPNAVSALKTEGACRRFSQAAEGLQRASDLLAGLLAGPG